MEYLKDLLKDRRIVLAIGGGLALLAGLGIAIGISSRDKGSKEPPPASRAGLVVESGREDDGRLDPTRPLRCFVAGQFVAELTLSECAQRNGVATGALDVGVDETGALAAADVAGTVLTPLPPEAVETPPQPAPVAEAPSAAPAPVQVAGPVGACWRYSGAEWRRLPGETSLNSCVQTLFAGTCEPRGAATYGRWAGQTLRRVTGKVEISSDNRRFRTLAEQGGSCSIAPVE